MVWGNPVYRDLMQSDIYLHRTYYMGNRRTAQPAEFYDGEIRIVDPQGGEFARYPAGGRST